MRNLYDRRKVSFDGRSNRVTPRLMNLLSVVLSKTMNGRNAQTYADVGRMFYFWEHLGIILRNGG